MNHLYLKVFSGPTSTSEILDSDEALANAVIEAYGSCFPGGRFTTAEIFIARDPLRAWAVAAGCRVAILNGLTIVWEGQIGAIGPATRNGIRGLRLKCVGQWGALLEQRTINKIWADIRLSEQAWVRQPQGDKDNQANVDRQNRISVGPQTIAWTAGEVVAAFRYTMPTGETIKRLKATLKNRENGQDWITRVYDPAGAATLFSEAGDGVTTATDHTLATPRQAVEFQFVSNANQTPTTAYGRLTAVTVYSETGGITPTSVMKNLRAAVSAINSDETAIDTNAFTLEPFRSNNRESLASIARRVMAFGDGSFNSWAAYLASSDTASAPDGKPVLCFKQYPALTDYDLVVRLGADNVANEPDFALNISEVVNWVVVRYRDDAGVEHEITPNDDANLKNQDSIDLYGERHLPSPLDAGTSSVATATNYARRVLAARKDARYKATQPIGVRGWIDTKQGTRLPACRIQAGLRILITNSVAETPSLITAVDYRPDAQVARLALGIPDSLAIYLAQRALLDDRKLV